MTPECRAALPAGRARIPLTGTPPGLTEVGARAEPRIPLLAVRVAPRRRESRLLGESHSAVAQPARRRAARSVLAVLRFDGCRVLVTGAASGIGRATALRFVTEGAHVRAVDRDTDGLVGTLRSVGGPGCLSTAVVDVTDEESVRETVARAATELGGIDVLVNSAGTHRTTPVETLSVVDLRDLYEVNLVGTAVFCREAVPHLPRGSGVIVNIASSAAAHGNPYMSAYAASKGAVLAFSLTLAAELVERGIRVVPVSPGTVATPLTAAVAVGDLDFRYYDRIRSVLGPATPDDIAGVIAFAASKDAAYLTGAEVRVDGGSHI